VGWVVVFRKVFQVSQGVYKTIQNLHLHLMCKGILSLCKEAS